MRTGGTNGVFSNEPAADESSITSNAFLGDDGAFQVGVELAGTEPDIGNNSFDDLAVGISLTAGADSIVNDNEITGLHEAPPMAPAGGTGIAVTDGAVPALIRNEISSPGVGIDHNGILVGQSGAAETGATLLQNRISNIQNAISVADTTGDVTLRGDIIAGANRGLGAFDTATLTTGEGDVTATNVTFASNATDIGLQDTHLRLDSSIVEDPFDEFASAPDCLITFSRGPTTTPGGNGCADFQTSADPMFVDALNFNFHLQAGSPMIDAGDPTPPAPGVFDIDGDPRAIDADGACPVNPVRDIGADEYAAAQPNCNPTPPENPAANSQPAPKKCKKGQKLKRGKCVKKKRRKRR
jgi:hypothetical protein